MLVKEWQLTCTMFDGDQLLGPVPTLFADNVEVKNLLLKRNNYEEINCDFQQTDQRLIVNSQVAKKALVENPAKAHQDVLRLLCRMSIPENIPPG